MQGFKLLEPAPLSRFSFSEVAKEAPAKSLVAVNDEMADLSSAAVRSPKPGRKPLLRSLSVAGSSTQSLSTGALEGQTVSLVTSQSPPSRKPAPVRTATLTDAGSRLQRATVQRPIQRAPSQRAPSQRAPSQRASSQRAPSALASPPMTPWTSASLDGADGSIGPSFGDTPMTPTVGPAKLCRRTPSSSGGFQLPSLLNGGAAGGLGRATPPNMPTTFACGYGGMPTPLFGCNGAVIGSIDSEGSAHIPPHSACSATQMGSEATTPDQAIGPNADAHVLVGGETGTPAHAADPACVGEPTGAPPRESGRRPTLSPAPSPDLKPSPRQRPKLSSNPHYHPGEVSASTARGVEGSPLPPPVLPNVRPKPVGVGAGRASPNVAPSELKGQLAVMGGSASSPASAACIQYSSLAGSSSPACSVMTATTATTVATPAGSSPPASNRARNAWQRANHAVTAGVRRSSSLRRGSLVASIHTPCNRWQETVLSAHFQILLGRRLRLLRRLAKILSVGAQVRARAHDRAHTRARPRMLSWLAAALPFASS